MAISVVPLPKKQPTLGQEKPGSIWRAPLMPVALAVTAGIVCDRQVPVPLAGSLLAVPVFLGAWLLAGNRKGPWGLFFLWCGAAAAGVAWHHLRQAMPGGDEIGKIASQEPRPALVRGELVTQPIIPKQRPRDPLRGFPDDQTTRFVLRVNHLKAGHDWQPVSGPVQVTVAGPREGIRLGDEVEIAGRLAAPSLPSNPGEFDYASFLRDQGIRATLSVHDSPEPILVLQAHGPRPFQGWLAWIGGWCKDVLDRSLAEDQAGIARALLLGDSSAMTTADWDKYLQTGVIHVLAISGQHLVVLGAFAWLVLRLGGVRRRTGALWVAGFLLGYALLVGARPPVMRSAWTVLALCGGLLFQRPVMPANSFALAWLLVAALNPADAFNSGCLLSFLAVAVLFWGTGSWKREIDPLEQLVEESRPMWLRRLRALGRIIGWSYVVNAAVWLAVGPLVAARFHLVSPIALIIGPPMVLLTSIALLSGFLLLLAAAVFWPLVPLLGAVTTLALAGCEVLVDAGLHLPGAYWFVPDIPAWWLWGWYGLLLAGMTLEVLRRRWRYCLLAGLGWLCLGLIPGLLPLGSNEFRCTFLAVGHGGCTVLETPDGRVLLYDAGAITGPDVSRRQIAPFLWSRGLRRIDEIFLSHADLDHFNGVPALAERFAIGQVTCTPTFADRDTGGVFLTLEAFRKYGIPVRIVKAGDELAAGPVLLQVLHPPLLGPEGNENARSMVLLVRHRGHKILLTGDLEGPGLDRVLTLPPRPVDLLMAPHHGSLTANIPDLARWASPRVVVSSQGKPRSFADPAEPYTRSGARYLTTWRHGAVTIRINPEGMVVETFRTKERLGINK